MGPGSESTLRIDEPLHLMFLVFYLITYFCCAYILFVCFKQCRRLVQRKPPRPVSLSRLRSVAEALNNLPRRAAASSRVVSSRQLQVSLCNLGGRGGTHAVLCPPPYAECDRERELSQMSGASDTADTISSNLSPLHMTTFTFRRIYYRGQHHSRGHGRGRNGPLACFIMDDGETGSGDDDDDGEGDDDLPHYETVSNVLPPSYSTCVLSTHQAAVGGGGSNPHNHNPCMNTNSNTASNSNSNLCYSDQDPHSHTHNEAMMATASASATTAAINDKVLDSGCSSACAEGSDQSACGVPRHVEVDAKLTATETKPV